MSYQITLTPDEYAALSQAATTQGKTVEEIVHEALSERFQTSAAQRPANRMSEHEFLERLYRAGVIANIPTQQRDTPEEAAERESLVTCIAPGTPLSEMVMEDRGSRE